MAKVNKKEFVQKQQGLPTLDAIRTHQAGDTMSAPVKSPQGQPQGQAALTEGEFVFSIPAIIGLGNGDYEKGVILLTQMHDELKAMGESMMGSSAGGLGSVP